MCKNQWRAALCMMLFCMILLCGTAWALMDGIVWPEATGTAVETAESLTIDYSHADQGYVMVHGTSTDKQLMLVVEMGNKRLQYHLNGNEEWEIIPLQFGDGDYRFTLGVLTSGNSFAVSGRLSLTATLANPNQVFLIPNQYVYYEPDTPAVAKSDEICAGLTTDQEKYEAIRAYIKENYTYDVAKAGSVTSGTLPSVDYIWDNGMGICQDLAALAACMLRVQGIPCKLEIGYVGGKYYHAWNSVIIDGQAIQYDPTTDVAAIPPGGYTLERYY